ERLAPGPEPLANAHRRLAGFGTGVGSELPQEVVAQVLSLAQASYHQLVDLPTQIVHRCDDEDQVRLQGRDLRIHHEQAIEEVIAPDREVEYLKSLEAAALQLGVEALLQQVRVDLLLGHTVSHVVGGSDQRDAERP